MIYSELRIMRGPNMWSANYQNLLAFKFNFGPLRSLIEQRSALIESYFLNTYNLPARGANILDRLYSYTVNLAAVLQGDDLFRDLACIREDICYGLVEYRTEEAGEEAVKLACSMVECIIMDEFPIPLQLATEKVQDTINRTCEGPTGAIIANAARKRNIPVSVGAAGYNILGHGRKQKRVSAAISHNTSCIAVNIAGDKQDTKEFLSRAMLPVPQGRLLRDEDDLSAIAQELGFPLVTKPLNGNQGKNITGGIDNYESLLAGFRFAKEISRSVIVEREISGRDYRLLVIGHRFVAGSLRVPACVYGNGRSTIAELVTQENADSRRGRGHENILTQIKIDAATELYLQKQGLSTDSVPATGQQVFLKTTANLSTGGTAEDVTDIVHPDNIAIAEKVSRVIGLDICGIDIMSQNISVPLTENGGSILEVNAAPGLRMHMFPNKGLSRPVGDPIVDLMFKPGENGRIPIVAITGTNGKTTTTRLMAHLASFKGYCTGYTTTDGIYINNKQIKRGDCSGPQSAKTVLQDPTVDFAVLECARGGIIRSGLAFDECDIAIVTNVAADHLGLKDIYTVADLAKVKSVVPRSVKKDGWAILNAADEHVFGMKSLLSCNVALFSSDPNHPNILEHLQQGGQACIADESLDIYLCRGSNKTFVINAADVPITRGGKAGFMIENLLPVVMAGALTGITREQTANAAKSFIPSTEQTPGRINEFRINEVNVIVDYAHNPHGMKALANYLKNIPGKKAGIITGTGDRRDEDIIEFGRISGGIYDSIIIRFDRDTRGRSRESIAELLIRGIHEVQPGLHCAIIPDTKTAIEYAVAHSARNSYVVICADDAIHTVGLTKQVALQYQN